MRRYGGKWGARARDVRGLLIGLAVKEREKGRRKKHGGTKDRKKKKNKRKPTKLRNLIKVLRCGW